jgi:hypothetical protein
VTKFPKTCARADRIPVDPGRDLTDGELTLLICSDCPFYKEGVDEELECGAYHIITHLLRKKVVTARQILDALCDED